MFDKHNDFTGRRHGVSEGSFVLLRSYPSSAASSGSMKGHDALALPRLIAFAELTWQPPGTDRQQPAGRAPSRSTQCACASLALLQNKEVLLPHPSHIHLCHGTLANASSLQSCVRNVGMEVLQCVCIHYSRVGLSFYLKKPITSNQASF